MQDKWRDRGILSTFFFHLFVIFSGEDAGTWWKRFRHIQVPGIYEWVEFYLNRRSGGLKLWFSSYGWFDIQWFRVIKFYIGSGFMGSKETAGPQRRYVLDYSTLICCFFIIRERKLITVGLKNFIHIVFSPTTVKKCFTKSNKTRGRSRFVFVGSTSNYPPLP